MRIVRCLYMFFFSSRRRHTRLRRDWSSDVCSSDLTGIGFGLLSFEHSTLYNLITSLIIIINLLIIYLIFKSNDLRAYFFILILGGSFGNLFDRLYYSAVPDFIDLKYKGYHWFIFNVADIFITLGIICLIFAELLNYKKTNEN